MSFPYKTVLLIGATSGIGYALAEKLIENGSHVIAVGRRQENLDKLKGDHENVSTIKFDITDLQRIPHFAERYVAYSFSLPPLSPSRTNNPPPQPGADNAQNPSVLRTNTPVSTAWC